MVVATRRLNTPLTPRMSSPSVCLSVCLSDMSFCLSVCLYILFLIFIFLTTPLPSSSSSKSFCSDKNLYLTVFNSDLMAKLAVAPPSADGLHQTLSDLLNQHDPASTRLVYHRPPTPWFSLVGPHLLEARCERRRAGRQWMRSGLTVHKHIFQTANTAVNAIAHSEETAYYSTNILACSTCKQLYSITNTLLRKSESASLPSTVHPSRLPRAFTDFFVNKIDTIRSSLDTDSTSLLTCNDPQFLSQPLPAFHPVSEDTAKNTIRQSSIHKSATSSISSCL